MGYPKFKAKAGPPVRKDTELVDFASSRSTNNQNRGKAVGRPISFPTGTTVCLLRDQGAWRLFHEPMSVLFHTDGRGMVIPEKEAPGTRGIPMQREEWPGGRHKKGDDDDTTHWSFFCPC